MEPQIPTSFIPKRPVSGEINSSTSPSHTFGLLSIFTFLVVVVTALSFGYVYFYQKQLVTQKAKLTSSIDDAKNNIGTDFINEMKRLSFRIDGVKMLLKNHIVVSPIFQALQATTLQSVQYKSFSYQFVTDPGTKAQTVQVSLVGSAKSYATIALQSDAFTQNSLIKNPIFSNLTVSDKTNVVDFKLVFTVDPGNLSYQAFIDSKVKSQSPITANQTLPTINQTQQ